MAQVKNELTIAETPTEHSTKGNNSLTSYIVPVKYFNSTYRNIRKELQRKLNNQIFTDLMKVFMRRQSR